MGVRAEEGSVLLGGASRKVKIADELHATALVCYNQRNVRLSCLK